MDFMRFEELRHTSSNSFRKAASCHDRIIEESLGTLLQDYDLVPKDDVGPPGIKPSSSGVIVTHAKKRSIRKGRSKKLKKAGDFQAVLLRVTLAERP